MRVIVILFFCISLFGCGEPVPSNQDIKPKITQKDQQKIKEQFVNANQQLLKKESDEIDYYVKAHKQPFTNTKLGIRYFVYKPSIKGDSVKAGQVIKMKYTVSLLTGDVCYSSDTDGIKTFKVGEENLESGIHRGVQLLKRGDKAYIIIPSHLAHGLLGDFKKIPPQMPIIYDVEIL